MLNVEEMVSLETASGNPGYPYEKKYKGISISHFHKNTLESIKILYNVWKFKTSRRK